jgi:hypothetical protein
MKCRWGHELVGHAQLTPCLQAPGGAASWPSLTSEIGGIP